MKPVSLVAGVAAAFCLTLTSQSALAAASQWAETTGGRMRVVALPPDADGNVDAILQIAPEPGWHTYWRAPGAGGIPPQISIENGGNLMLTGIEFPTPQVITYDGLQDYGYLAPVSLPLNLKQVVTGVPSTLNLTAFVGVCAEICVPFQADLKLTVSNHDPVLPDEAALITAARTMLPEAPGSDFFIQSSTLSEDGASLEVKIHLPEGASETATAFYAYDGAQAFKPGTITEKDGNLVTVSLKPFFLSAGTTLHGRKIGILTTTGLRAMESELTLSY